MSFRSARFKIGFGVGLALLLACLVAAIGVLLWIHSWGHYSSYGLKISADSRLIAIFQAHKGQFASLQGMASEDADRGWYFQISRLEGNKPPRSRQQQYRDLVSRISPDLAVTTDVDGSIRFILAGGGTSAIGPGWAKGIEYVPGAREINGAVYSIPRLRGVTYAPLWKGIALSDLDSAGSLPANVYLRCIDADWFIFYQRDE